MINYDIFTSVISYLMNQKLSDLHFRSNQVFILTLTSHMVRVIFLFPLIKSCFPSSSSSSLSCLESVGWERYKDCAAAEIFCSRATARKYFNTLTSIVSPPASILPLLDIAVKHMLVFNISICYL